MAFKEWLLSQRMAGATYSELSEMTEIAAPELMAMAEPNIELDEREIENHLAAIGNKLGIDFKTIWAEIPEYKLGPM